ncbi:MAG: NAD(P)H-dependent oxidoreductase [Bacteroidota bacterium]
MKKKILAFGASNSRNSINKQLASYAAGQLTDATITLLDLNDFEMPIYSIDREKESGIPQLAEQFKQHVRNADGIVISFAEHNGAYTAAFKNVMDWMSRLEGSIWEDKPMLLLATSPGGRGGKNVLDLAYHVFSFQNKNVSGSFSLPRFKQNFSPEEGVLDPTMAAELRDQLAEFEVVLAQ